MESVSNLPRRKSQQRQQMLHTMNSFRKSNTFCDVVLIVDDHRLQAHKVVLAASSPFFKAKFTSDLTREKASDELEVNIPDFEPDTVEELLNFIYTGEVGLTEHNAIELFAVADYYDIPNLKETCAEFLIISLKPSNCLSMQIFAERFRHDLLYEAATDFICNNLTAIWETKEYLSLEFAEVKELFSSERLAIKTGKGEEDVFRGVNAWVKHDPENRTLYFEELFRYVHLNAMSLNFVNEVVNRDEFVSRSRDCQSLVTAALIDPDEERDEPRGVTESIVLLSKNGCASCYIPVTETWFDLPRLPSFNQVQAVTICEGFVNAIGWEDDRITIEKFDPRRNRWLEVVNDMGARPVAAVAVEDRIFILNENGAYCFTPADSLLEEVAPMESVRRGLCAVALHGFVYAIGGHDGRKNLGLNSVERYDPETNQWEYVASMDEQRCFASATVINNKILVVGGTGDCFLPLSNCELYDPITDIWSLLPAELNVPRSEAAIGRAKKKVFVFGGTYSNGIVECYDNENEQWREVGRVPTTTNFIHACVIWLPKAMFKSLKGERMLLDQQND